MSELGATRLVDSLDVARRFIAFVLNESVPSVEGLVRALDELAFAYHFSLVTELTDDDAQVEPPGYPEGLYHAVAERFPDLGLYAVSNPTELKAQELMVGDAVDDLADIVRDLQEVIWRAENQSEQGARWYFRLLFQIHWGRHLRELSWYLHDKEWG